MVTKTKSSANTAITTRILSKNVYARTAGQHFDALYINYDHVFEVSRLVVSRSGHGASPGLGHRREVANPAAGVQRDEHTIGTVHWQAEVRQALPHRDQQLVV